MSAGSSLGGGDSEELNNGGGKWEDEEERRFFEEIPDLKDYVPWSVLGIEGDGEDESEDGKEKERKEKERVEEEVRKLEEELAEMKVGEDGRAVPNGKADNGVEDENADELVFSKFCLRIYQVLTAIEVCPRRRLAPLRRLQPLLRSWRLKDRLSFLRRSWRGFQMLPTGPSLIRRRLTSLSSTQRRRGRGLSSS